MEIKFNLKRKHIIIVLIIFALISTSLLVLNKCQKNSSETTEPKGKEQYTCPMHPGIISDKPGQCPICHMDLQKVDDNEAEINKQENKGTENKAKSHPVRYTCPMHPGIISDKHGQCPVCHMDLVKVEEDTETQENTLDKNSDSIAGRTSFSLSNERQQIIGVTSATVTKRPLQYEIRATGKVAFDPELYTAIEEYRQSVLSSSGMDDSGYQGLKDQANELVGSSRTKLKLMGLSNDQIRLLANSKTSALGLLLPGGKVWIYAEIFEYEMSGVKIGQSVEATAPAYPGKVFLGKISSISPILNAPTRTIRVRAEIPDTEGILRPDTFLNVKIKVNLGTAIAVPEDAVLHSGDLCFVFIMKEKGRFEPRQIVTGKKANEFYEVLSGLSEGEIVVTAANFLIDSESRLRSALKNMSGESTTPAVPGNEKNDKQNQKHDSLGDTK